MISSAIELCRGEAPRELARRAGKRLTFLRLHFIPRLRAECIAEFIHSVTRRRLPWCHWTCAVLCGCAAGRKDAESCSKTEKRLPGIACGGSGRHRIELVGHLQKLLDRIPDERFS